jgi:hypothetical protein
MRFMMITNATKDAEAGKPPDPRMMEAVVKLTEELTKSQSSSRSVSRRFVADDDHVAVEVDGS